MGAFPAWQGNPIGGGDPTRHARSELRALLVDLAGFLETQPDRDHVLSAVSYAFRILDATELRAGLIASLLRNLRLDSQRGWPVDVRYYSDQFRKVAVGLE